MRGMRGEEGDLAAGSIPFGGVRTAAGIEADRLRARWGALKGWGVRV